MKIKKKKKNFVVVVVFFLVFFFFFFFFFWGGGGVGSGVGLDVDEELKFLRKFTKQNLGGGRVGGSGWM